MSLSEFAAALEAIDPRSEDLQAAVALHVVDALLCLCEGMETREGAKIADIYALMGSDPTTRAASAAAVIRFTEWDDIHVPSCMTPGAIAVPVALAFAPSVERLISAVAAGAGTGIALARAVGGVAALTHGVWPTLFAAPSTAAATAAVAMGLSRNEIIHALAISLAGVSGRNGRPAGEPSARWFAVGEGALKGMRAALAAKAGLKGDTEILSPAFLAAQSKTAMEGVVPPQGDAILSTGIKPFVAARQGMNAIEAFRRILRNGVAPDMIDSVRVALPSDALPILSRPLALQDRLSTVAHLGLQIAVAAFEPQRLFDVGREAPFGARTLAFVEQVEVVADDDLGDAFGSWPAEVTVTVGGQPIQLICSDAAGDNGSAVGARNIIEEKLAATRHRTAAAKLSALLKLLGEGEASALDEASWHFASVAQDRLAAQHRLTARQA